MYESKPQISLATLPVDPVTAQILADPSRADIMARIVMRIAASWDCADPPTNVLDTEIELSIAGERAIFGLTNDQAAALRGNLDTQPNDAGQGRQRDSIVSIHEMLIALARVMGGWHRGREWLFRPHPSLGSRPIDMIATNDGACKVAVAILRAEYSIEL